MRTRRTLLAGAATSPLLLSSCTFGYDADELVGGYRAERNLIKERLLLRADGTYLHRWSILLEPDSQESTWRVDGSDVVFDDYVAPVGRLALEAPVRFPCGPPTYFLFGKPTFFSFDLDVAYKWVAPSL